MKKLLLLPLPVVVVLLVALWPREEPAPERPAPAVVEAPAAAPEPAPQPAAPEAPDSALVEALLGPPKTEAPAEVEPPKPATRVVRRRAPVVEEEEPEAFEKTSLTDFDFQSTVGAWSGVKGCLATTNVRGEEPMNGAIEVLFEIRADGAVVTSKVVDASNQKAMALAPCVEKKARRIKFPTFASNEHVTKRAKFVF